MTTIRRLAHLRKAESPLRRILTLMAVLAVAAALVPPAAPASDNSVAIIVRESHPATSRAQKFVEALGGEVLVDLEVIDGFSASIPAHAFDALTSHPSVASVTPDGTVTLTSAGWDDSSILSTVDFRDYPGSLYAITRATNATSGWLNGAWGQGIDIAMIDTGVAPVRGLPAWKVVNGPDLSFDSQEDDLEYLDGFGHGTHMAGIMTGLDLTVSSNLTASSKDSFVGMAPASRVVNVKVGASNGAVDVSQVIAAIDWIVEHKSDNGMNIRVLNLSFGTESTQPYVLDPLAYAAEQAWKSGIVVVAAAGNDGNSSRLRDPAYDPYVLAVGSAQAGDLNTSAPSHTVSYDRVSPFSNCGTSARHVDVVAPGKSITSLRVPGSYVDETYPYARVGERFFLGSGTSQAAAVVSGAVAQILSADPTLTPDEVKHLITTNAQAIGDSDCLGAGLLDLGFLAKKLPRLRGVDQDHPSADGSGLLEAARGGDHLVLDGVELEGESDVMGNRWIGFNKENEACRTEGKGKKASTVCGTELVPVSTLWNGGTWNGGTWSGTTWSGVSWSGVSWSGVTWSGVSWSGVSWSDVSWSDHYWNGVSWSGTTWSGTTWSGVSWSGNSWTSGSWLGRTWG